MPRKKKPTGHRKKGGGGGGGRGRGGRGNGGTPTPQPKRVIRVIRHRIHNLPQNVVLRIFNLLDEEGRVAAFTSMGYNVPDYPKQREMIRKNIAERQKRVREAQEAAREKQQQAEEEKKKEDDDVDEDAGEGAGNGDESEEGGSAKEESEGDEGVGEITEAVDKCGLTTETSPETDACEDANVYTAVDADADADVDVDVDATSETEVGYDTRLDDADALKDSGSPEEGPLRKQRLPGPLQKPQLLPNGEMKTPEEIIPDTWLPPLAGRPSPELLLARLNTRRLHRRLVYFRTKQRKVAEKEEQEFPSYESRNHKQSERGAEGSMIKFFEDEIRKKAEEERMYPKNFTVEEMADEEWEDLLDAAHDRQEGKPLAHEPIPTQYELLQFTPCPRAVAILASYPRSGNSLMRTLYEHTTRRVTGSDMQGGLAKHDLVGEMAVGANMVQFVKTHFPERRGSSTFPASRVVLLVRNPFDAIDSYFNLMMTGTHTTSISDEVREKSLLIWKEAAVKELRVWKKFHEYWLKQDIPMLLVRYEDLVRRPDKVMERVLQFVLEIKRMGTFFTERVDRCIREQQEIEKLGSYKPRSGGIGKSMSKYSPDMLKAMEETGFSSTMNDLGYGDLLKKPAAEWGNLAPLVEYGTELAPSYRVKHFEDAGGGNPNTIQINEGELARSAEDQTKWAAAKRDLGLVGDKKPCNCKNCVAKREKANSESKEAEGGADKGTDAPATEAPTTESAEVTST